ncbi:ferredoxin Fer [Natronoglomus mannanivorans]|uniref:ferredoxin Fer n=1 Tax=Natronoglomus mannanivorans TaxID=2979990 RepID=UPI003CCE51FD
MFDTVLVPTDGSPVAETAGEYGCRLAERFDADLHVVHVEEDEEGGFFERERENDDESGERAVATIAEIATERAIDVTRAILEPEQEIHREILEYATANDVDCLVMGTHGRSGLDRYLVGSVAEQTLRESPVPVVTVHEGTDVGADFDRVLIPTDGSASAMAAAEDAIELAVETGARIHVVHVSDRSPIGESSATYDVSDPDVSVGVTAVDDVLDRTREAGLESVDVSIPSGRVDQAILAVAAEHDVDCLVMGTHGRTGIRRYLLGSTTERVVRFASVPVFAVRAPRGETIPVEYLDYATVDEQGWAADDADLFEKADAASLDSSAHGTLEVGRDEYVLDAAEAEGNDWPFHCRAGGCVNCVVIVTEGEIEMDVQRSLSDQEVDEENLRLTCVGTPASESIKLVYNAKHLDSLRDRVV